MHGFTSILVHEKSSVVCWLCVFILSRTFSLPLSPMQLVEERQCGTVLSVLDGRELYCCFERNMQLFTICLDTVSKVALLSYCVIVHTCIFVCDVHIFLTRKSNTATANAVTSGY